MTSVSHDPSGNVYGLGRSSDTLRIEDSLFVPSSLGGIFLVSYDPQGVLRWTHLIGEQDQAYPWNLVVDGYGNSFVVGDFRDTLRIGNTSLFSRGARDIFVARYDPSGIFQWVAQLGGEKDDHAAACAVDISSAVYLTGSFQENLRVETLGMTATGVRDLLVAVIGSDGHPLGIQGFGGTGGSAEGNSIFLRGNNDLYIAGTYRGPLSIGPSSLQSTNGSSDAVVLRFRPGLVPVWGVTLGGNSADSGLGVASAANQCVVAGSYSDSFSSAGVGTLQSAGGRDCFVALLDTAGRIEWTRSFGGLLDDAARSIGVRRVGSSINYFVTGEFRDTMRYGDTAIGSAGGTDIFVGNLKPAGALGWVVGAGGAGDDVGRIVDADATDFNLCGDFQGTARFGDTTLAQRASNGYVARFSEPRTLSVVQQADTFCAGSSIDISFEARGYYPLDNEFVAELSDSTGSFATTVEIGRASTGSQPITLHFPDSLLPGSHYRLRMRATNPTLISADNGADLVILSVPHPVINASGPTTFCAGGSVTLTAPDGYPSYQWSTFALSRSITVDNSGEFWVVVPGENGCRGQSQVVTVTVLPSPIPPLLLRDNNRLLASSSLPDPHYQWIRDGEPIAGATSYDLTPDRAGRYTVTLTDSNGCSSPSLPYDFTISSVVEANDAFSVRLVDDAIIVAGVAATGARTILLTDALGRLVLEVPKEEGVSDARLPLQGVPSGLYHLIVAQAIRTVVVIR